MYQQFACPLTCNLALRTWWSGGMLMIFSFSTRKTQLVVNRTCSATTKLLTLIKIINIDVRMILEIVLDTIETYVKRKNYFQVGFLRLLVLINWLRTSCFPCGIISSKNYTIAAGKCMPKLKKICLKAQLTLLFLLIEKSFRSPKIQLRQRPAIYKTKNTVMRNGMPEI